MGCFGGCLGRIFALAILVMLIWAAWRFGPEVAERLPHRPLQEEGHSPEVLDALGREVWADLSAWVTAHGGVDPFLMGGMEAEALFHHRAEVLLPPSLSAPRMEVEGGEVRASVRVARSLLPAVPELDRIQDVLPDSVTVAVRGGILTDRDGQGVFLIRRLDVAGVPVPRRFHDPILSALNLERGPDLPEGSVVFPLPAGVESLHASGGFLILRREP
ncbi:MAG: hypothetical protein EA422_06730 [Gemmatimonadales bacterium]|nr:MAG: hypothetical protein EA422_06730 [Gemmatimonadales bacterium]